MKKIAIFVEGHAEAMFVGKLISEILNQNSFTLISVELTGPILNRKIAVVRATAPVSSVEYYFMIYNCQCDNAVKSDMLAQYPSLIKSSYTYDNWTSRRLPRAKSGKTSEVCYIWFAATAVHSF